MGGLTSEQYLRDVTIGEPTRLDGTIHLVPYDTRWPAAYEALAKRIRAALGDSAMVLEHVGSTAVPALAAKPIIDIVLGVRDCADEAAYVPALERRGFRLTIREPDWFGHRLLKCDEIDANVHVFSAQCEEIARMVAFRDRLRANAADRRSYEALKRELAARHWRYLQHYADSKSEIVREILARGAAA